MTVRVAVFSALVTWNELELVLPPATRTANGYCSKSSLPGTVQVPVSNNFALNSFESVVVVGSATVEGKRSSCGDKVRSK